MYEVRGPFYFGDEASCLLRLIWQFSNGMPVF